MQLARRRLRVARYSIGAVTISAFAALGFAVRDAHPATHQSTTAAATTNASTDEFSPAFGGNATIGPAPQAAAPSVQSGGS
jgi:hypothetical protein